MLLKSYHLIRAPEGRYIRMHNHKCVELVYYFKGFGKSTINSKGYAVKSGVFTVTPTGIYHDQENYTDLRSFCILLDDPEVERLTGSWVDIDGSIRTALFALLAELNEKLPGYEEICKGVAYEVVGRAERIVNECQFLRLPSKNELVTNAVDLIEKRLGKITVAEVAESANISPDYLRHLFGQCVGKSPHRYIMEAKLERAKAILSESDLSISGIADVCGFGDVYYFSNFFKKETTLFPTDYRHRRRAKSIY